MADPSPAAGLKLPPGATLTKQPSAAAPVRLPQGATLIKSGGSPAPSPGASAEAPEPAPSSQGSGADLLKFHADDTPITFDRFMQGAETWARGATFGWSDDASAGLAAAILKAKGDPRAMYDIYQQLDAAENARIDAFKAEHPAGGRALEIGGMFTTPGAGPLGRWIGQGTSWIGKMGRASLAGAGTAAAAGGGYAKPGEKAKAAATAAPVGAVLGPVAERVASFVGPAITPAAKYLRDKGVRALIGQNVGGAAKVAEEKVSTIPVVGDIIKNQQRGAIEDFNRAAYNDVLAPLGQKVPKDFPVGNKGFSKLDDLISDKYDAVLPHVKLDPVNDSQFLSEFQTIEQQANLLPQNEQKVFKDTINHYFVDRLRQQPMSGTEFKKAESILSQNARDILSNPNSTVWDQNLAYLYKETIGALRNSLERTNPNYAGILQPINKAYMLLIRVQKATAKIGAKDGIFTPGQLLSSVKSTAPEKQFARGNAPMQELAQAGDAVLSNKYPDSGSIGRLLLAEGGLGMVNPKAAAGVAGMSLPYLLPRGWNATPLAQSTGQLLRNMIPGMAGSAGAVAPKILPRYIGEQ